MIEFSLLLAGHFLADIGLQPDWVLKQKYNVGKTQLGTIALIGHAFIHFLVAYFIATHLGFTHAYSLALVIGVTHFIIDLGKIKGRYGVLTDQIFHFAVIVGVVLWFV